jgi:hypothetical protein
MDKSTTDSIKAATLTPDDTPDPLKVPLLHRFALTLFMATDSHLQRNKNNETNVTEFLETSGIIDTQIPHYLAAIKAFDKDADLKDRLEKIGPLLKSVLGGNFYPTNPCPGIDDSIKILQKLQ